MTPRKYIYRRPRVIPKECATPGCSKRSGYGVTLRFCKRCSIKLADIAEQIKIHGQNLHKGAMDPKTGSKKRIKRAPTCCTVGCYEPRVPPDSFCNTCVQNGAVQSDD